MSTQIIQTSSVSQSDHHKLILSEPTVVSSVWTRANSSSILEIEKNKIGAVWKASKVQGESKAFEISISMYEKDWSLPKYLVTSTTELWSPVFAKLPSGELGIFYREGNTPRSAKGFLLRSSDNGHSWSKPEALPNGILGPTKSKPLLRSDNVLLCGSSKEIGEPEKDDPKTLRTELYINEFDGKIWKNHGPLTIPNQPFGAIEPALFHDKEGNIRLVCRDRAYKLEQMGWIYTSISRDGGVTWDPLQKTTLPNPDCGIDCLGLGRGKALLFYNDSHTERNALTMALTVDGGHSWKNILILEKDEGQFPSAMLDSKGMVHVTYAKQGNITHRVIDASQL
ncbi:MAG: exo-alpha-sialidase [Verrucomicrobia bacterium]|nr:exo-alpha-sialidase [Verrucomicrobiota bacterium]